jgi:alpha-glucoside transport system permease protein
MATTRPLAGGSGPALGRFLWPAATLVAAGLILLALGFLRDPDGPTRLMTSIYDAVGAHGAADALRARGLDTFTAKMMIAAVALGVGVGGVWLLYLGMNAVVDLLGDRLGDRIRPYVFVGPAVGLLGVFLVVPTVATIWSSLTEGGGAIENYGFALTDPEMWVAFRNNVLWLVLGTSGSVALGLVIATLVDRVKREALAKTFIFLPLAISMVGAAVIWRFVYAWQPAGETQIGIANAAWTALGNDPVPWVQQPPLNTPALIVIMIWLQTGFAMVVLSAALKGVPSEVVEAARLDGASELRVFSRIVVPIIRGSILAVATTVAIAILKVFDIVYVMTGGRFETEVVANRMFTEMFTYRDFGHASAIAVILFLAVVPIMVVNIRNLRRQGIGA